MEATPNLLDLVPERFQPLYPLEEQLIRAAPLGTVASCFPADQPIDMDQIGDGETVRSDLLVWLLTARGICEHIHYKGVHLRGAKIEGKLDLQDAKVEYSMRLKNCTIHEGIILDRGSFTLLDFSGSHTGAISADLVKVHQELIMSEGFKALGEVRLNGANIRGQLICNGGTFENPKGVAFGADGMISRGDVYLGGSYKALGEVRLIGANIGGQMACNGGTFVNPDGNALNAQGLTVAGNLFLRNGFKAQGEVRLSGANINGQLNCSGGTFENPGGYALNAQGMTVSGSLFLCKGFKAKGAVLLICANIGEQLVCSGGTFENPGGTALSGQDMKVNGSFYWLNLKKKPVGRLDLISASLGDFVDDEASWPEPGRLFISGLTFGPFTTQELANWKMRLKWMDLRHRGDTSVQPYEQLIHVMRQMGLTEDAKHIAIAKQRKLRQHQRGAALLWSWMLDKTIAYGYRPERVILLFILPIILLGALIFALAFQAGVMEPSDNLAQTMGQFLTFDPFGYSLDVFLPIVDLHQESAWIPNAGKPWGLFFQYYKYLHILAGWFFTTLAVAAVTGLVRKD